MPRNSLKTALLLIIIGTVLPKSESRVVVRLTGVKCLCLQRDYCEFTLCRLKAVKRGVTELSVYIKLLQLPVDNITLDFGFTRRFDAQNKRVLGATIDGCAFWRNKRRNPLAELLYKVMEWEKYSNINHSCPYDHDIFLNGYHVREDYINYLPLPAGHFNAYTKWWSYNVHRATVTLTFQLIKD